MKLKTIKSKRAAIELSIGTIVIVVLAMSMLILGIVLVQKIFRGATESVETLNDKVKGEITNIFAEEGSKVAIKLGADKTAKIKSGTGAFSIGFGAKTEDDSVVGSRDRLQFKLTIVEDNNIINCAHSSKNGGTNVKKWFVDPPHGTVVDFDEFESSHVFSLIQLNIPDSAKICTQKVNIDVYDNDGPNPTSPYAGSSFTIEIKESGIFS